MLEIWSSEDPLAELEAYLAEAEFFGARDDLVADVFLGYGISRSLRRAPWPDPPEPCRLPLAAARIRRRDEQPPPAGRFAIGEWQRSWDDEGYAGAIEGVQAAIARGDVYQVNLVQHLHAPFEGDPAGLAPALAPLRPLHPAHSSATAGRSSPPRPSSSSRAAATASGRSRSRARARPACAASCATPRRTRPSTS